jgi:spermidine synthase/MFS family permease
MNPRFKYFAGIFLISFSTLLFELSLTRVFSVTLWYHFGFLIISTALLGFGVSGVLLSLWKKLREEYNLDKTLGWLSIFISLSIIICFWLLQQIPFDPFSLYADKMQFLYMPLTYIIVSIPFFFAGLALSLLFTRFPEKINRLYAFDLVGAAFGCLAIIFTMSYFGGGGSVLFAATFAATAAILFFGKTFKTFSWISFLLLVITFVISLNADKIIPLRITDNKAISLRKKTPVYTKWNTFSRIDLYIDSSKIFPQKKSARFVIDQGTAATGLDFDMKPNVKTVLQQYTGDSLYESCLAYLDKKNPSVLIIGSGCGTQVLDALHHGTKKVTAVEINPIINDVVQKNEYWADLFYQPQVELVTDEARNYIRSSKEKYDAIISAHTISNAAIASGALSLSENYVLTKEAFEDYYNHLTDSGIIYFTRPEFQLPRLFSTGREVLEENGIKDAAAHFYAYTHKPPEILAGRKSFFAVFLMSKKPLSQQQVVQMNSFINLSVTDPPIILYNPFKQNNNIYDSVLSTKNLTEFYKNYSFEISPATDNEPFFNHHTRWSSLNVQSFKDIFSQQKMGRMALEDKPIAEVTLIVLLIQVLIISALFILLPLWKFSSKGLQIKNIFPILFYFSGLGFGFIMIEIVMIQLFSLLLGEPVYTFAIVLAALLLFTGIGSYISGRYSLNAKRTLRISIISLSALLLLASFFLPPLLRQAIALSMTGRVILAVLLIMPLGILLGMPFPSGIQLISKQVPALIPWAWGVNGFFTVIGSVVALILSMMVGFQAVLWIAIVVYLLSLFVINRVHITQAKF